MVKKEKLTKKYLELFWDCLIGLLPFLWGVLSIGMSFEVQCLGAFVVLIVMLGRLYMLFYIRVKKEKIEK